MPRKWQTSFILLIATVVILTSHEVRACPYCPRSEKTLGEKLLESDAAFVVKFLDSKNGEELSMQTTTFEVVKPLPGKDRFKKGVSITTNYGITAKPGDHFLLMGQSFDGEVDWNLPIALDELWTPYTYLTQAPSSEESKVDRLSYFLKYFDHENSVISNDAIGEFARAEFNEVAQLAPKLSRRKLRDWIDDPNPQLDVRRGFYGMLLGLCGNEADGDFLEQKILAPIGQKIRLEIEGMTAGYLLLRGEAGLRLLIEKKLTSLPTIVEIDDPRIGDSNALRMTIVFLWDYRRSQFTEEPLRAAMRKYLDRPEFAELAVVDLARWKDWKSLDPLIDAYGKEPWNTRAAQAKVVIFALSCLKDSAVATGSSAPVDAAKAQAFLDGLDPDFVQSVKRSQGLIPLPIPRAKSNENDGRS